MASEEPSPSIHDRIQIPPQAFAIVPVFCHLHPIHTLCTPHPHLLGIVVVDDLKRLAPISEVARVDTDLLKALRDHHGDGRLEVDVCHQRDVISTSTHARCMSTFRPPCAAPRPPFSATSDSNSLDHPPILKQPLANIGAGLGLLFALDGDSDDVSACVSALLDLHAWVTFGMGA